ncbi:MAG: DUF4837 family protein [Alistipes sp.]|jgi:hypothetical protein|nr:DUF4837 family protein [Alistipes sp.]
MAKYLATLAVAALLVTGCGSCDNYKFDAQGASYEIVVVADHNVWDGPAGDTLRGIFHRQFPMINRQETTYDVLRVLPEGFNKLVARHRNILMTRIDPTLTEATLGFSPDSWAKPQAVLNVSAPDLASLTRLITDNRDDIMLLLENAEKDRDVAAARSHTPPQITSLIKEKFGFEMSTGPGYAVRDESEDFLWLSYEMPTASQGIVIYTYPFSGVHDFDLEKLLARRDEFVKRILAENPGSHMATNPEQGFIEVVYKTIEGRPWAEMLGFWDTVGDFMGGPYRNFSTIDAANQRVIAIDFYVYSPDPRLSQRNYIKQLEHFIYTVNIPAL